VLAAFLPCAANEFLWDDEQFIVKNAYLSSPALLGRLVRENIVAGAGLVSNLYRPVQSLTHYVDVQLWGLQPAPHHLMNVGFHAALAAALWAVLARLCPPWPAALAALWYALHPMQVEAVAYTSGRGDTLAMLFLCLGLLAFPGRRWLALACAALAMGSKESLALFPAFLLLHESAAGRPIRWRRHLPFWMLSAAYVLARLTILNFKNTLNFYEQPNVLTESILVRIFTYLTTIPKALQLWLWPVDLHHERSWMVFTGLSTPVVAGMATVAALWLAAWMLRRRARLAAAGIAWFFVATIPTSNLLVLINALFYDHWFLLPGIGVAWVLAQALAVAWERAPGRQLAVAGCAAAILAGLVLTERHIAVWRTPVRLYTHILRYEPRSAKIHNNLAMAYADGGQFWNAVRTYRRAIALSDEYAQTHHNLATAYLNLGLPEQAVAEFHRAVELDPRFHHAWISIAALRAQRGQLDDAEQALRRALAVHPFEPSAYVGLAFLALQRRDPEAARQAIEEGLRRLPKNPTLLNAQQQLERMAR
jgi:tetratricopeptide (TPR) repeat protein